MKTIPFFLFSLSAFGVTFSHCQAQDQAVITPEVTPGQFVAPIEEKAMGLEVLVSFEAKHLPLSEVLTQLNQQSAIQLKLEPEFQNRLVTARVTSLSLSKVMTAVSKVFNFTWTKKSDTEYLATALKPDDLDNLLTRIGDAGQGQEKVAAERANRGVDWYQEVAPYADLATLNSKEGVAASVLPEETLQKLRKDREKTAGLKLIQAYWQTLPSTLEQCYLVVDAPVAKVRTTKASISRPPGVSLRSPEGNPLAFIISLGKTPELFAKPNGEANVDAPPGRR